jgi:hypothetical protein
LKKLIMVKIISEDTCIYNTYNRKYNYLPWGISHLLGYYEYLN